MAMKNGVVGSGSASSSLRARTRLNPDDRRFTPSASTSSPTASLSSTPSPQKRARTLSSSSSSVLTLLVVAESFNAILRSLFTSLGLVISTYQIPSLLVSGLLICSLLSPTLLLYFSPTGPVPLASSAIARRGRGEFVWELEGMRRQGVIASDDEVCWDQFARYYQWRRVEAKVVRMEQILVSPVHRDLLGGGARAARLGGGGTAGVGALGKATLHKAYQMQNELERRLIQRQVPGLTCVKDHRGRCAIASPVEWWNSEEELLGDPDVHKTISKATPSGEIIKEASEEARTVPLTTTNTLVGIGRDRKGLVKHAHHLAITFYLEDAPLETWAETSLTLQGAGSLAEENARAMARAMWKRTVSDVVSGRGWATKREQVGTVIEGRGPGVRITLKHLPHLNVHTNPRLLEDVIYFLSYLVVLIYVTRAIRRLPEVHSKGGLIITGIVELTASGIMSLSVCWLLGWSFALVPWNLCAFLVLVCGVDNMLLLTNAVGKTDMRLPVHERIAAALASEGPPATLMLLCEVSICSLMRWLIKIQVMREILLVIEVVLVVDFCLEMTFFPTILSIDLQRLELADLLRGNLSNARQLPATPSDGGDHDARSITSNNASSPEGTLTHAIACAKKVVSDRAAAMITFALLALIDTSLYIFYGPDHFLPAFCSETALSSHRPLLAPSLSREIARSLQMGQRGESARRDEVVSGAGAAFWRLLNPSNASSAVHVYVEPPSIVRFYDDGMVAPESASIAGTAIVSTPWWIKIGIVVAPIAVTLGVLYLLLLYLLKDAELLQVQRLYSKQERDETANGKRAAKKAVPEAGVSITTLRARPQAADIELIASSPDAIVAWAALEEQIYLWRTTSSTNRTLSLEPTLLDIPLAAEPPSLVALALDPSSRFCATATMTGRVLVWDLERRLLIDFTPSGNDSRVSLGPTTALSAAPSSVLPTSGKDAPPRTTALPESRHAFVSIHQDGTAVVWDCVTRLSTVVYRPQPLVSTMTNVDSPVARVKHLVVAPPQPGRSPLWPISARLSSATGQIQLAQSVTEGIAASEPWKIIWDARLASAGDPITAVAFGRFEIGIDTPKPLRSVVVLGSLGGTVSIYIIPNESGDQGSDKTASPSPSLTLELDGPVRQLRLAPGAKTHADKCSQCGDPISDGFFVVASSKSTVFVDRVFSPPHSGCSTCSGLFGLAPRGIGPGSPGMTRSGSLASVNGSVSKRTPKKTYRRLSHGVDGDDAFASPSPVAKTESRRPSVSSLMLDGLPVKSRVSSDSGMTPVTMMMHSAAIGAEMSPSFSRSKKTPSRSPEREDSLPVSAAAPASASTPADVPLYKTTSVFGPDSTADSSSRLHAIEAARCANDERGGWDLVERSIIGVRRQRETSPDEDGVRPSRGSGPMSWFVWSVGLQMGATEGASSLDGLVSRAAASATTGAEASLRPPTTTNELRRRRLNGEGSFAPDASSPLRRSTPTIRFEPSDLPFSRARPVVAALGDGALAIGLANQIAVVKPRSVFSSAADGTARLGLGLGLAARGGAG